MFQVQNHVEKICICSESTKPVLESKLIGLFPPVMPRMKVLDIGFYPGISFARQHFLRVCNVAFVKSSITERANYFFFSVLTISLIEFFLSCFPNLEELNVEGTRTVSVPFPFYLNLTKHCLC